MSTKIDSFDTSFIHTYKDRTSEKRLGGSSFLEAYDYRSPSAMNYIQQFMQDLNNEIDNDNDNDNNE